MYHVFTIQTSVWVIATLSFICFLGGYIIAPPEGPWQHVRLAFSAIGTTATIIALAGTQFVFDWIWRVPIVQKFMFPYINGKWSGTITSNWATISAGHRISTPNVNPALSEEGKEASPQQTEKRVNVEIQANLFSATMTLMPEDRYSESISVSLIPVESKELEKPRLYYIYKSSVKNPQLSDEQESYGAAFLEIIQNKNRDILEGNYWTNRKWKEGLNTAGMISLNRMR